MGEILGVLDEIPWWLSIWALISWSVLGTREAARFAAKSYPGVLQGLILMVAWGPLVWMISILALLCVIWEGISILWEKTSKNN